MKHELISQSAKIFGNETIDKWNAFLELCFGRNEIRLYYFMKFKSSMLAYFKRVNPWDFVAINQEQYRWFLIDYKQDSICVLWDCNRLYLWGNPALVKIDEATELLKSPEYAPILGCFKLLDYVGNGSHYFYGEVHNYKFDDREYTQRPDNEQGCLELSWYAGNKTDALIGKYAHIDPLRTF